MTRLATPTRSRLGGTSLGRVGVASLGWVPGVKPWRDWPHGWRLCASVRTWPSSA